MPSKTCWFPNAAKPLILCGSERSSCTPRCHRPSADVFLHSQSSSLALILHSNPQDSIQLLVCAPKKNKNKINQRRKKKQETTTTGGAPDIDNRDLGTLQGHQTVASDEGNGRSTGHRSSAALLVLFGFLDSWPGFYFPRFAQGGLATIHKRNEPNKTELFWILSSSGYQLELIV